MTVRDQEDSADDRQQLLSLLKERCVIREGNGWLASTSGGDYRWLIDMRPAFLTAATLDIIVELFWKRYRSELPFQICGLEVAGIPLIVGIVLRGRDMGFDVNAVVVRKERKNSGVGKILEGALTDDRIIVVDDILNSANSVDRVRVVLGEHGRVIDEVFVVVDYLAKSGISWRNLNTATVNSVFTLGDFGLNLGEKHNAMIKRFSNIWSFESPDPNHFHVTPKSSPAFYSGLVIFGSDGGTLWARHQKTGEASWSFHIANAGRKGIWSRPAVYDDKVYFGGYDGNFYCLSAADGREIWRDIAADWIGSSPVLSERHKIAYVGLEYNRPHVKGAIAAFDALRGEKIWEFSVPDFVHAAPSLSADERLVAFGGNDFKIYLLDALSGELKWSVETQGEVKEALSFDPDRNSLYSAGFDGVIRSINIESGAENWCLPTGNTIYSQPIIHNGKLYVSGCDKLLHIIQLDTLAHQTVDLGAKSLSTPTAIGGNVFLGTNAGAILEIDGEKDIVVGRHLLPDPVTSRVVCSETEGTFFALTHMNQLFCFSRQNVSTGLELQLG